MTATRTRYERQVQSDIDMRLAVHEMRKVRDDVTSLLGGNPDERDLRRAIDAADRRYERVAERLNKRVYGEVQAWMQEVHDQQALVLALATSGVNVGEAWSAEEVAELREGKGLPHYREMVEVLEVVLMELDRTVAYRQTVSPSFSGDGITGTEYHGHTLESLAGSPRYPEMVEDFRRAVEGRRVIAYNAPWAADVMAAESARHGVSEPVPGLGEDDCVMLQRGRCAAFFLVSEYAYRKLKLGSLDRTPTGVATTVCDVVETYRTWETRPPEEPYDPEGRRSDSARNHAFGWRAAEKPEHDRKEREREEEWERREAEAAERKAERRATRKRSLLAIGMPEGVAEAKVKEEFDSESDFMDIPF